MKKILALIVALAMFLPLAVDAAGANIGQPYTVCDSELQEIGAVHNCTVSFTSSDDVTSISGSVAAKDPNAVKIVSITPSGSWKGEMSTSNFSYTHANGGTKGGTTTAFTVVKQVLSDDPSDDCGIVVRLEGQKGGEPTPDNPKTGETLPYIIVGGCAVLALGAYLVASKKTKLHKI